MTTTDANGSTFTVIVNPQPTGDPHCPSCGRCRECGQPKPPAMSPPVWPSPGVPIEYPQPQWTPTVLPWNPWSTIICGGASGSPVSSASGWSSL